MEKISVGDIVLSKAGRDAGRYFLVVDVIDQYAYITDGKIRKVVKPKKKNLKHLKTVETAKDISLAEKIKRGEPTSDERVKKAIRTKI